VVAASIEQTTVRLAELRHQVQDDAVLAALAFCLSLVASLVRPELAAPLFAGGLTAAVLALRSFWRRWDLLDRLLLERDAYAIPEVRSRGERAAAIANRLELAAWIRSLLADPVYACQPRVRAAADELELLAAELADPALELAPISAVECERLLVDGTVSPLLNTALPADEVRRSVRRIRAGFQRNPQS
jgi:hypothetical protein